MPSPKSTEGRDLFEFLAERLIQKAERQPISVVFRFADGERVVEIGPKDRWYKELSRRRSEALRGSLSKLRQGGKLRCRPLSFLVRRMEGPHERWC